MHHRDVSASVTVPNVSASCLFMIVRPPPGSTLFPYTTLFRSARDRDRDVRGRLAREHDVERRRVPGLVRRRRSEEHTSELQSRLHLVCRLLLEKKKPSALSAQFRPRARRNRKPTSLPCTAHGS